MPALFVGHGNPMNAIEPNALHRSWQALAAQLPHPRAILCVSAHWETAGVWLTAAAQPATLHDFHGFPPALYAVRYPAPGAPELARRTAELLAAEGARLDPSRGLDHGAWGVLAPMFPDAEVPVVQLSLARDQPPAFHYALAGKLAPLRDEGVLILGSGNIVHNLREFDFADPTPAAWALRFDETVRRKLAAHAHAALIAYESLGGDARLAVPTPEHYLPLLYVLAQQGAGEALRIFNDVVASTLSMTSFVIGNAE
jgi:4,5-DOPA dioxygenase extradiol